MVWFHRHQDKTQFQVDYCFRHALTYSYWYPCQTDVESQVQERDSEVRDWSDFDWKSLTWVLQVVVPVLESLVENREEQLFRQ